MKWKVARLELASNGEFPRGSAGRTYLIRLPLANGGAIDMARLQAEPGRATVRRYWPNEADMIGHIVPTPSGLAIRYSPTNGGKSQLFRFGADSIQEGSEVMLTDLDGRELPFRIAALN